MAEQVSLSQSLLSVSVSVPAVSLLTSLSDSAEEDPLFEDLGHDLLLLW
jgi:hypothetical protein